MQMSQMHYLPLAPGFFAILVGFFFIVLILRSVRYAYESLGVSSSAAIFLLFATLIGSFFNIPIAELSPERVVSDQVVEFFGMRYVVPVVSNWGGTVVAVNVGGAVIPTLMSAYLLIKRELWLKGLVATAIVALVIHGMADPVPGLGIAVPIFMPVLVTAVVVFVDFPRGRARIARSKTRDLSNVMENRANHATAGTSRRHLHCSVAGDDPDRGTAAAGVGTIDRPSHRRRA